MTPYEELCQLIEALHEGSGDASPRTRLSLLNQINAILQHPDAADFEYHYYVGARIDRDFAEAYLEAGDYARAAEHAVLAERHDIAGRAHLAVGEMEAALDAFQASGFKEFSKGLCLEIITAAKTLLGDDLTEAYFKTHWIALHAKVVFRFGTWASAMLNASKNTTTTRKGRPSKTPDPHKPAQASEAELRLRAARGLRAEEALDRQIGGIEELIKRGELVKAEATVREAISKYGGSEPDDRLEQLLSATLLLQRRFESFFALWDGRYLGSVQDSYFCAKLLNGKCLTGAELIRNFYFLMKNSSPLLSKVEPVFIDHADQALAEFHARRGMDPLRAFIKSLSAGDRGYRWVDHYFGDLPGDLRKSIDRDFGPFYFFRGTANFQKLLSPVIRRVEARVRKTLGVVDANERWKSERALFEYVKTLLPDLDVKRHASPQWLKPQHFDVFVPSLGLGIEYMGEQHFEAVEIFGGSDALDATRERDERKVAICAANGVSLLHVRFDEPWDAFREALLKARGLAISEH